MPLFTIAQLDEKAKTRPNGYRADVLAQATLLPNGFHELSSEAFEALAAKYRPPTFFDKLASLGDAAVQAIKDPSIRTNEEMKAVTDICRKCEWLIEDGFKCGSCGCPIARKAIGRSWHCPLAKW